MVAIDCIIMYVTGVYFNPVQDGGLSQFDKRLTLTGRQFGQGSRGRPPSIAHHSFYFFMLTYIKVYIYQSFDLPPQTPIFRRGLNIQVNLKQTHFVIFHSLHVTIISPHGNFSTCTLLSRFQTF